MRTLDPILIDASENRNGIFICRVRHRNYTGSAWSSYTYADVYKYRFTKNELTLTCANTSLTLNARQTTEVVIERGLQIGGVNYYVDSPMFYLDSYEHDLALNTTKITAKQLPYAPAINIDSTDVAYNVLLYLFLQHSITPEYGDYVEVWRSTQFNGYGFLSLSTTQELESLIAQKYLVSVWAGRNGPIFLNTGIQTINASSAVKNVSFLGKTKGKHPSSRYFIWTDEVSAVHTAGNSNDPVHNLGYIPTTVSDATVDAWDSAYISAFEIEITPDFALENGDVVEGEDAFDFKTIFITEEFDNDKTPSLKQWVSCEEYPSPISASKTLSVGAIEYRNFKVDTSYFNSILSNADNTLQSALDKLDDHNHNDDYAPIAKGVTNGDSHNHSGGDGAQIAHGNLSSIGTNTHAQIDTFIATTAPATYAPIAKGVTNGDSHDHSGGDGAQIAHGNLSSIGTNTHAQIDTHLAAANPHSGHPIYEMQTINDDAVYSFTPNRANGVIIFGTASNSHWGTFFYNTAGPTCTLLNVGSNVNATTGALTGTTGTDTKTTVSAHSTNGKIYIENRGGANRNYYILQI